MRWWRPALATLGLVFAAFFYVVYRQVLTITQKPSWPPTPTAITAAGAQAATEQFAARSHPRPADVGMPYAWSTAATIDPWPEGKNFFPRIFADVEKAHSSVHILMFGWREGEIGTKFADLLVEKMKQGVEVRIIVDGMGSKVFGPAGPMFTRLADAGAQIVVNDILPVDRDGLYPDHRTFDWRQDEVGHADHRKLYVIDGKVAWTGGAGIEDHFENGGLPRRDGACDRGRRAPGAGALPDELPRPRRPAADRPLEVLPRAAGRRHDPDRAAPGRPRRLRQSATQAIRELIDNAKTRLDIMNPYFTDADIIQRVIGRREARRQGADRRLGDVEQRAGDRGLQAPLQRR